jgi:hypothetical protein
MILLRSDPIEGKVFYASGRTKAAASRRMAAKIAKATGLTVEAHPSHSGAWIGPPTHFAETPRGDSRRVCFRTKDGRIVCKCGSTAKAACNCERKATKMQNFAETPTIDIEEIRRMLLEAIEGADEESLQKIGAAMMNAGIIGDEDDEQFDDAASSRTGLREPDAESNLPKGLSRDERKAFAAFSEKFGDRAFGRSGLTTAEYAADYAKLSPQNRAVALADLKRLLREHV